jgi:hypothetical protein
MKPVSIYDSHPKLKALGFNEIRFADSNYVAPSRAWLTEFAAHMRVVAPSYKPEKFDCENFARLAASQADLALYASLEEGAGHTFGEATCTRQNDQGKYETHALNLVICDDGEAYAFEPQNGAIVRASDYRCAWGTVRL